MTGTDGNKMPMTLRDAREMAGLTPKEAAKTLKIKEKTLKNYENSLVHCKLCCPNPKMNTFGTLERDKVGHEFGNIE